jgi:DNA invertase Pin-like site-specific DNA recombinase
MKVLYTRISTIEKQKSDRQLVKANNYDYVIEDKISGSTEFATRPGGSEVIQLLQKGILTELAVWEIDRLGRNMRDIVNTIHYFTQNQICIHFVNQGIRTLNEDGSENPISKLIINILGVVSEMERTQLKERQFQGIQIAKARGVYKGRNNGTKEDIQRQ